MKGYKTFPGLKLEWIYDQPFLIAGRSARKKLPAVTPLNATAARIWTELTLGQEMEQIAWELADDYDLEKEQALRDVMAFCGDLLEKGYLIRLEDSDAG